MSEHAQPTIRQLSAQIAEALGETEPQPIEQIRRLIKVMGWDFAQEVLREAQAVEAEGHTCRNQVELRLAAVGKQR